MTYKPERTTVSVLKAEKIICQKTEIEIRKEKLKSDRLGFPRLMAKAAKLNNPTGYERQINLTCFDYYLKDK